MTKWSGLRRFGAPCFGSAEKKTGFENQDELFGLLLFRAGLRQMHFEYLKFILACAGFNFPELGVCVPELGFDVLHICFQHLKNVVRLRCFLSKMLGWNSGILLDKLAVFYKKK